MIQKPEGSAPSFSRLFSAPVLLAGLLLFAGDSTRASTWVWTGGGANGLWNNNANWGSAGGFPTNGDSVIFQGTTQLNSTNNIVGLTLGQIRFINSGFNLYGNPFTLTNSIVATNFTGTAVINNGMTIATADVSMLVSNGVTLTLNANVTGTVGVVKSGQGTVLYQGPGNNTYTGTTLVTGGTLELNVNGTNAFLGPLVIGDGTGLNSPTAASNSFRWPNYSFPRPRPLPFPTAAC